MSANPKDDSLYMTKAEYLEFERDSLEKHEFINGLVRPLSGDHKVHRSPLDHINHNRLIVSLSYLLVGHLIGTNCEALGSSQRLTIEKVNSCLYPDLTVICGEAQFTEDSLPALLNPTLIIGVLSPSTEAYDRGKNFQLYRQLDSLREYVLVAQDSARIECFYLNNLDIWELTDAVGLESNIRLKSIDCRLKLADVYANVVFEDAD